MKRKLRHYLAIICIVLGFVGMILPVMPTVPFLLAALALAQDAPALEKFLRNNAVCKRYIEGYQNRRPLPWYVKYGSLAGLWISLGVSLYLAGNWYWRTLIILIGIGMSCYFLRLKKSDS